MKISLLILLIVLFCFSTLDAQNKNQPTEFQSWNEIRLIKPLLKRKNSKGKTIEKITATFTGNLRIGRKSFDLLDNRIGASFEFRINNSVSALTGVLYREDETIKNRKRFETRFDLGVNLAKDWHGLSFRNREMYEHRFRNSRNDLNLYRNRIQISYSLKYKEKEIFSPYISEEGYFDIKSRQWIQNEFFIGISRKISRMTTIEVSYLHNDAQPYNVDGVNIGWRIKLK